MRKGQPRFHIYYLVQVCCKKDTFYSRSVFSLLSKSVFAAAILSIKQLKPSFQSSLPKFFSWVCLIRFTKLLRRASTIKLDGMSDLKCFSLKVQHECFKCLYICHKVFCAMSCLLVWRNLILSTYMRDQILNKKPYYN